MLLIFQRRHPFTTKFLREPSRACSHIRWHSYSNLVGSTFLRSSASPSVNSVCNSLCACVCAQDCICMCKFVWAQADVCHVFAVISFSCRVSQDLCYTVCSACQARLRLHSNSQHCARWEKNEFFSADLLWKGSKYTHTGVVLQQQSRWIALGCFSLQGKTKLLPKVSFGSFTESGWDQIWKICCKIIISKSCSIHTISLCDACILSLHSELQDKTNYNIHFVN